MPMGLHPPFIFVRNNKYLEYQLTPLFLFPQRVSVMGLVWPTVSAVQVDSVSACPTLGGKSVMGVLQATMDTQTVLVSGSDPSIPPV